MGAAQIGLVQFSCSYLLLLLALFMMWRAGIDKTKLLVVASLRMTVQLILVGFLLTYIFGNPKPIFTVAFLLVMLAFSIHRILTGQKGLNKKFKLAVAFSLGLGGLTVLFYFVLVVVREDIFNPQYTIPLAGMIMGNAMTGLSLGLRSFMTALQTQRKKLDTLLNLGVAPKEILKPMVSEALQTALMPTINSMMGMGIIFLPGMMTGQLLSGTVPTTAILYQIAIMIAICTAVCLVVFCALHLGYRTLYNARNQMIQESEKGVNE